jgi:hypothetical protein
VLSLMRNCCVRYRGGKDRKNEPQNIGQGISHPKGIYTRRVLLKGQMLKVLNRLVFSCRGCWSRSLPTVAYLSKFHANKVTQFGELLRENILYPLPHRQYALHHAQVLSLQFPEIYMIGYLENKRG